MNSWTLQGQFIDFNGLTATSDGTAATLVNPTSGVAWKLAAVNVAANFVFAAGADDAVAIVNGPTTSNHCWTAVAARPDAVDAKRAAIAGYVGSITTCLKHAIDGYSFWGATVIARVGKDWAEGNFTATDAALAVSETGTET